MNFRNNFFQNNNMPGGYPGPMGSNYNNQLHGQGGFSMRNANIPMPNNMYPAYNNQGNYPTRINSRVPATYGPQPNYNNNANMPGSVFPPYCSDMYGHSRTLEANNRRDRYNINAEPIAKERRRLAYVKEGCSGDSYNYDDYHDDDSLRSRKYRKDYKTRFFTKLASNKKLSLDDLEDERDTEFYSSREDKLRKKRKARDSYDDYEDESYEDERNSRNMKAKKRSKSRYEDDEYDDYEDESYEDERNSRNMKAKKCSKSRYEDDEYDDYEDESYEDERNSRNMKAKKRSKSRYEDDEYDDYEDDVYDSMNRRPRFVSGPIDFLKKKRRA